MSIGDAEAGESDTGTEGEAVKVEAAMSRLTLPCLLGGFVFLIFWVISLAFLFVASFFFFFLRY